MKLFLAAVVALLAVIAANVALLSFGGDRHDPVGNLSPIATIPISSAHPPAPPRGEDD